jgi:hypothetical protein
MLAVSFMRRGGEKFFVIASPFRRKIRTRCPSGWSCVWRITFISVRSRAISLTAWRRVRMLCGEHVEVAPFEHEELAEVDGNDVGRAAAAAQKRHLAEEGARLQPDRFSWGAALRPRPRREIHAVAAVALAHHALAG